MRSAIIFGHFALCALFILVSGAADDIDYTLPDENIDLNVLEARHLEDVIAAMYLNGRDMKNPRLLRDAEKRFKDKTTARSWGFDTERTAYELALWAAKNNVAKIPRKILEDLKSNADLSEDYPYNRDNSYLADEKKPGMFGSVFEKTMPCGEKKADQSTE